MRKKALQFLQVLAETTGFPTAADPLGTSLPVLPVNARIAAAKAELLGTDTPDAEGLPTDLAGLRSLIRTMLGQQQMPTGSWGMSHYRLAMRVAALETVQAAQQAVLDALAHGYDQQSAQVQVLTANLQLAQQRSQALDAKQTATDLRLTAIERKENLVELATEANRLDILKNNAADALRDAQALKDEAAIATAQATATQARTEAATAQARVEQLATSLLAVQAKAEQAQATATAAQQGLATFAARFRSVRVTLPQIPLLALDVVVTFPPLLTPTSRLLRSQLACRCWALMLPNYPRRARRARLRSASSP